MHWDSTATAHLSTLVEELNDSGLIAYLHDVTRDIWRANVERQDDALFDDAATLGYTASRNVANRVHAELRLPHGQLLPAVSAAWTSQSVLIRQGRMRIRIVKAPVARGRSPRFREFRWEEREGRAEFAASNFAHFQAPRLVPGVDPLFTIERPDAASSVAECNDLFVVWAGDADALTAGWVGIPTLAPDRWLAVEQVWFDQSDEVAAALPDAPLGPRSGFAAIASPEPKLRLRDVRGESDTHVR